MRHERNDSPGLSVPLHSHAGIESFFVHSGQMEVFSDEGGKPHWRLRKRMQPSALVLSNIAVGKILKFQLTPYRHERDGY